MNAALSVTVAGATPASHRLPVSPRKAPSLSGYGSARGTANKKGAEAPFSNCMAVFLLAFRELDSLFYNYKSITYNIIIMFAPPLRLTHHQTNLTIISSYKHYT